MAARWVWPWPRALCQRLDDGGVAGVAVSPVVPDRYVQAMETDTAGSATGSARAVARRETGGPVGVAEGVQVEHGIV